MAWEFKGLLDESIKSRTATDNTLNSTLNYFDNPKFQVKLNGGWLKTIMVFTPNKTINLYIVFKIKSWSYYNDNSFMLRSSLFGGVRLTKILIAINILILDMVFHFMYVELFHYQMGSSVHVDNKKYLNSWQRSNARARQYWSRSILYQFYQTRKEIVLQLQWKQQLSIC